MHISELNKQFDALEGLSDEQKDLLIEEGLVFGTRAKLTFKEAARHCWKDKNYVPAPGVYSGYIIVSNPRNWEEAERWAKVRGLGETLDGVIASGRIVEIPQPELA